MIMEAVTPENYMTAEQLFKEVLQDLYLDGTNEAAYSEKWIRWAWMAITEANLQMAFERASLTPDACVQDAWLPKPSGYILLERMVLFDDNSQPPLAIVPSFKNIRGTLPSAAQRPGTISPVFWQQSINSRFREYVCTEELFGWQFSSNANGMRVHVDYMRYHMDANGFPMFPRTYYPYILAYCRLHHIQGTRTTGVRTFSQGDEQMALQQTYQLLLRNRSTDFHRTLNYDQLEQIMAAWTDPFRLPQSPNVVRRRNDNANYATRSTMGRLGNTGWSTTPFNNI